MLGTQQITEYPCPYCGDLINEKRMSAEAFKRHYDGSCSI